MISDAEHLFMYLLAIWILVWGNVYSCPLPITLYEAQKLIQNVLKAEM